MRCVLSVVLVVLSISGCGRDSDRSRVEKINEDNFAHHRHREAHFVVDLLDTSYGLVDVAKMGEGRLDDAERNQQLQELIQSHTSAILKLKAYAEKSGITVPFSGPDKTKKSVKRLKDKSGSEFSEAWIKEMRELQHRLKRDIESYQRKSADKALLRVLDSTLYVVKTSNGIIARLDVEDS